jgi:hypothetical protein
MICESTAGHTWPAIGLPTYIPSGAYDGWMWWEPIVTFLGGIAAGVLPMAYKNRQSKKSSHESEQKQIRTELLERLSRARNLENVDTFRNQDHRQDWIAANVEIFTEIRNFCARLDDGELRARVEPVQNAAARGSYIPLFGLADELADESEFHLRGILVDDAYEAVAASLRGERQLPKQDTGVDWIKRNLEVMYKLEDER